jgi:hypothetical protein
MAALLTAAACLDVVGLPWKRAAGLAVEPFYCNGMARNKLFPDTILPEVGFVAPQVPTWPCRPAENQA